MDILSDFGETLLELIADNNLTPESLANAVKLDRSLIYKYLRKEILPTLPNLITLADYFQCSVDYLIGLTTANPTTVYKKSPPFSQRFKWLLEENGYSRYAFRKKYSFAKQSIDDWYHGKRYPTVENTIKLSKCFNCSVDNLLGRE